MKVTRNKLHYFQVCVKRAQTGSENHHWRERKFNVVFKMFSLSHFLTEMTTHTYHCHWHTARPTHPTYFLTTILDGPYKTDHSCLNLSTGLHVKNYLKTPQVLFSKQGFVRRIFKIGMDDYCCICT